jgi:ABC-2 type transport system ATP-binding protein
MIILNDLHVRYGNNHVIKGLNLDIADHSIHGLVGLNGAGKTTLLNAIYGLKEKAKGEIRCGSAQFCRRKIAFLETENYFYPRITGMEYLKLFRTNNPAFDIDKWNEFFELPLHRLIESYSNGMKKKLALLGVIALDREILMLDEPFNGLDLETVEKLKRLLPSLKSSKTILITSHILESLLGICDSISYLNGGMIQFTRERREFDSIEDEIFAVHRDRIDQQIKALIGKAE